MDYVAISQEVCLCQGLGTRYFAINREYIFQNNAQGVLGIYHSALLQNKKTETKDWMKTINFDGKIYYGQRLLPKFDIHNMNDIFLHFPNSMVVLSKTVQS